MIIRRLASSSRLQNSCGMRWYQVIWTNLRCVFCEKRLGCEWLDKECKDGKQKIFRNTEAGQTDYRMHLCALHAHEMGMPPDSRYIHHIQQHLLCQPKDLERTFVHIPNVCTGSDGQCVGVELGRYSMYVRQRLESGLRPQPLAVGVCNAI